MRPILIATLALSSALLHAQAIVPAQPQNSGNALQSKLVAPATPSDLAKADRGTATSAPRVSTGVVEAKLIHTVDVPSEPNAQWQMAGKYRSAVVEMVVDKYGKPSDLKLIQSAGGDLDKSVLYAVRQYRFKPATVSNMPVAMTVALTVNIHNPIR